MAFVYLLSSKAYGTLYVGSTFDLPRRIFEHKTRVVSGFTAKYGVDRLVCMKPTRRSKARSSANDRSRSGSGIGRSTLIERDNPYWLDLSASLTL
ncbi:MAG TPA: GIY-YIG nuclease family protein [Stellaceae bacterium]|nr:GIY-YIG nuclease family protein [Stellaceae bacterium]